MNFKDILSRKIFVFIFRERKKKTRQLLSRFATVVSIMGLYTNKIHWSACIGKLFNLLFTICMSFTKEM